jgi:xanthine/uracil permease
MDFKYGIDDRPPLITSLMLGLQWCAVSVPFIIIIGKIAVAFHHHDPAFQTVYLQKMFFVTALCLLGQILWGHRLPLVTGPSSVLLIGVVASRGFDVYTIYSAAILGGLLLTLSGLTGFFGTLKRLFTPRIVAVILLLIAFVLSPISLNLIISPQTGTTPLDRIGFALILTFGLFLAYRYLTGIWKSTLIIWGMIMGSIVFFVLFPGSINGPVTVEGLFLAGFFSGFNTTLSFDPGVFIAFLICFVALSINELGSIQSMNELLKPPDMSGRITRGITVTGLGNVLSGFLGVVGPVSYSLSFGVVTASGCASRVTLVPAALTMLVLSFSPAVIGSIGDVPPVVIGSILIYVLCSQVAAGLMVAFESEKTFQYQSGLIIGLPILAGSVIAYMPPEVVGTFPTLLRPILGNGFVVGIVMALLLEHIVFNENKNFKALP